ncbi:phage tail protein, partial [Escherichia coli]
MTVSTEVDHNEYTGNGVTTTFPYTFRIFQKSDLVVQVVDLNENITELILDTDYIVTGAGGYNGGNIILSKELVSGYQISISRELPVTQETDLRNQGKFFAEVHEDAFDKLTMLIQQVRSWFSLALRKPSFVANYYDALNNYIRNLRDPSTPQDAATKNYVDTQLSSNLGCTLRVQEQIPQLPDAASRANKMPAFDNDGNPIVVLPPSGSASDVLIELAKPTGSDLVGYGSQTVKATLDSLNSMREELLDKTGFNALGRFLNLSELRSCVPEEAGQIVYVASAASTTHAENHLGGGFFESVDNIQAWADDGGIVIKPETGTMVWRRINFTTYDMQFWGVKPDGVTDN